MCARRSRAAALRVMRLVVVVVIIIVVVVIVVVVIVVVVVAADGFALVEFVFARDAARRRLARGVVLL